MIDAVFNVTWLALVGLICYKAYEFINFHFYMERCEGLRFVEVPTSLFLNRGNKDDDEFDDPLLRKLAGQEEKNSIVAIRYTLDLESVSTFYETTGEVYDGSGKIKLNMTCVEMFEGGRLVVELTYDQFKELHDGYFNTRYKLI